MGGGPDQEELLITLPLPEREAHVAEIQRRFPHIKVTWVHVSKKGEKEDELKGAVRDVTSLLKTVAQWINQSQPLYMIRTNHLRPRSKCKSKCLTLLSTASLKLIHLYSAGIDHLTSHPLYTSSTIPITTSSGIHGPPIAEWVLASLLSLTRNTFLLHTWQQRHEWASDPSLPDAAERQKLLHAGGDWAGKTVGIAGYGAIGRQVARVLVGLGVKVHVFTAGAKTTEAARRDEGYIVGQEQGLALGDREGTLPVAWYSGETAGLHPFLRSGLSALVVALPLTKQTERLFGTKEFELLRDGVKERTRADVGQDDRAEIDAAGCYFVNIARGKIVDQDALIDALNDGTLKGAALDVTDPEPLPKESKLWDARNCIVTPHVSGLGREYTGRALDLLMENLRRWEQGEGLMNEVRRKRGY